jgi:hypothetical protein
MNVFSSSGDVCQFRYQPAGGGDTLRRRCQRMTRSGISSVARSPHDIAGLCVRSFFLPALSGANSVEPMIDQFCALVRRGFGPSVPAGFAKVVYGNR